MSFRNATRRFVANAKPDGGTKPAAAGGSDAINPGGEETITDGPPIGAGTKDIGGEEVIKGWDFGI